MKRRAAGQSMIEFVMAAAILTPIVLIFADSATLLYTKQLNEKTCVEAARLASSGTPKLLIARATEIVSEAQANAPFGISLKLVSADTTVKQSAVDALNPYGGEVAGTVSITTEATVTPNFIRCFLGKHPQLTFRTLQEVPCTYSLPSAQENVLSQNGSSSNVSNGGPSI